MLGQITIQLAELRRAELHAEADSHRRAARNRTTITARLFAATPRRHARERVDHDVVVACCTAPA